MDIKNGKEKEIIEASGKVFSEYGFHGAKMQKIADVANVGKGTIYEYFSSKNQLFEEMIKYFIISYIDSLEDVINESDNLEDTLLEITKFHGLFIRKHIDMWNNLMGNQVDISDDMKKEICAIREKLLNTVSRLIRKYKDKGDIRNIDEKAFVISLFGSLNLFYAEGIGMEKKKIDDIDPKPLIDILINGIK
ncbi:TetR/AcrR family transcriptional regulator [Senegalia sp. (in: firmicutes)]|uniref:TetR/AcrR family transcriptional regulator n=2 Tax=Senegalia sp. (in: firmicutes) TaxID=1924098 RepID=UPI003F9553FD